MSERAEDHGPRLALSLHCSIFRSWYSASVSLIALRGARSFVASPGFGAGKNNLQDELTRQSAQGPPKSLTC